MSERGLVIPCRTHSGVAVCPCPPPAAGLSEAIPAFLAAAPSSWPGGYGHPRLSGGTACKTWMPDTGPGMTGGTRSRSPQRFPSTWVQMAIIPTNSANEANAAASWITALNMIVSPEQRENIVHHLFQSQVARGSANKLNRFNELPRLPLGAGRTSASLHAISVILPSRKVTRRSMRAARSILWVAMMAARPEALTN